MASCFVGFMARVNRKHLVSPAGLQTLAVMLFGLLLAPLAFAQTTTGSVQGTITDSSGAVIPGVQVAAQNVDTGISTSAVSNSAGIYSIRYLPTGRYTIVARATSFSDYKTTAFHLDINQDAVINIAMQVQSASANVEVLADVQPILDEQDPTLGVIISGTSMASLPLSDRDIFGATVAVPGAVHTGGTANEPPVVNGNRPEANAELLDGVDIYDNINGTSALYNPNPDAIQEMKVITSNAGAEYSQANGGVIVAVTKSGTNQVHGNAFVQLENYNMNANTWANKHTTLAAGALNPNTQTYFGGTVGGPIVKDKLFAFADYQGLRNHYTGTAFANVVPQSFLKGDFSALLPQIQLTDSQNNFKPFARNQVPVNNPVAKFLLANPGLYPAPNLPLASATNFTNDYIGPQNYAQRSNQGDIKIDWKASSKDTVSGRFTMQSGTMGNVVSPLAVAIPASLNQNSYTSFVVNEVHEISNAIVNEARIAFGRNQASGADPTDPSGLFGTSGNSKTGINLPQGNYVGFALQSFNNSVSIGGGEHPQPYTENNFIYADQLSMQFGRHQLKAGAQFVRYQQNFSFSDSPVLGHYSYSGAFTGYDFADFLMGYASSLQALAGQQRLGQRQWRDGVFIQDDYQVTSNLVFNLGLRWDYSQPIYESNNKELNIGLTPSTLGIITYAGVNGASRALYNPTYDQFLPRIGFAYTATPKFVIRGGFGAMTFFEGMGANGRLTQNPPFTNTYRINSVIPSGGSGGTPLYVTQGLPTTSTSSGNYNAWDTNNRPAWSNQYNLTTEYQLTRLSSIQIGYVGNVTNHLGLPMIATQLTAPGAPSRFANLAASTGVPINQLRIVETRTGGTSNYNGLQTVYRIHNSHGLDLTANYTYSHTLSDGGEGWDGFNGTAGNFPYYQQDYYNLPAEYASAPSDAKHVFSASAVYELPYGKGKQFGSHINRVTDLALGGWKISAIASAFTGFPIDLSSPEAYSSLVNAGYFARPDHLRRLIVKNRSLIGLNNNWFGTDPSAVPCVMGTNNQYLSGTGDGDPATCAYGGQPYNRFGNSNNAPERGPGFRNVDLSIYKGFRIADGQRLDFRADAFNAFNFANYADPNSQVTNTGSANPLFGQITANNGNQRILQLGLNYHF